MKCIKIHSNERQKPDSKDTPSKLAHRTKFQNIYRQILTEYKIYTNEQSANEYRTTSLKRTLS